MQQEVELNLKCMWPCGYRNMSESFLFSLITRLSSCERGEDAKKSQLWLNMKMQTSLAALLCFSCKSFDLALLRNLIIVQECQPVQGHAQTHKLNIYASLVFDFTDFVWRITCFNLFFLKKHISLNISVSQCTQKLCMKMLTTIVYKIK